MGFVRPVPFLQLFHHVGRRSDIYLVSYVFPEQRARYDGNRQADDRPDQDHPSQVGP